MPGTTRHHEDVVSFGTRQLLDMFAPTNFLLTDPDVSQRAVSTFGMSLLEGARNALEDAGHQAKGQPPVGLDQFKVGVNLAVTPGQSRLSQSPDRTDPVQPHHQQGTRRTGADRACVDHEILHTRSFAA